MAARRKWRTLVDGAEKSHQSEAAVYRWIAEQPQGTRVRIEVQEPTSTRWQWFETEEARG